MIKEGVVHSSPVSALGICRGILLYDTAINNILAHTPPTHETSRTDPAEDLQKQVFMGRSRSFVAHFTLDPSFGAVLL